MIAQSLKGLASNLSELFDAFEEQGFELYLVGGCVRDALLADIEIVGFSASSENGSAETDIDLTTNALPDEVEKVLRDRGFRVVTVGARFGTIATFVAGVEVEITTYRAVEKYEPGNRKPEVKFGERLEEDLSRRDLSINAMAADRHGQVIDAFEGQAALRERCLEVPGGGYENTLSILTDDPLRLLRIARFSARLDFRPSAETTRAASRTATSLRDISRERWKMEMDKMLVARHVGRGLRWLGEVGALEVILPESAWAVRRGQLELLGTQIAEGGDDVMMGWSALVAYAAFGVRWPERSRFSWRVRADDSSRQAAREAALVRTLASRYRFSRAEKDALVRLVTFIPDETHLRRPWTRPEIRRFALERGDVARSALRLQVVLADDVADLEEHVAAREAQLVNLLRMEDPEPCLPSGIGKDIIEAFGLSRGPIIARAVHAVREAVIDEELPATPSISDCLAWLRRNSGWSEP